VQLYSSLGLSPPPPSQRTPWIRHLHSDIVSVATISESEMAETGYVRWFIRLLAEVECTEQLKARFDANELLAHVGEDGKLGDVIGSKVLEDDPIVLQHRW